MIAVPIKLNRTRHSTNVTTEINLVVTAFRFNAFHGNTNTSAQVYTA